MSSNAKRFAKFHREVSADAGCDKDEPRDLLCFVPDWCDSLAHRIATGDLIEATLAWAILTANGNHSKFAVHRYSHRGEEPIETPLRQVDAALQLAWIRAGHRWEWLDAPLDQFREEAERRGVVPIDKTSVSHAFTFNKDRGTIQTDTGYLICPVPAPKVADSTEHLRTKGESSGEYLRFVERWNVAHSAEFQEEQVARATIERINKVRLSAYREERKLAAPGRNGTPSLEDLETYKPSSSAVSVYRGSDSPEKQKAEEEEIAPLVHDSPEPEAVQVAEPVQEATWEAFSKIYPPDRLDGPKARPLFAALTPEKKRTCIESLLRHLSGDRWIKSPKFIPFASNWLKSDYEQPPPPFFESATQKKGFAEEVMGEFKRQFDKWGEIL